MNDAKKDIERLLNEMDQTCDNAAKVRNGEVVHSASSTQKNQHFDAIVTGATMLMIFSMALFYANQATKQQVAVIASGSVGASAGLLVGYAVGRRKGKE